ncbi:MAG: cytochrome c [Albidovulum sp.]
MMRNTVICAAAVMAGAVMIFAGLGKFEAGGEELSGTIIPDLTGAAVLGQSVYADNCAACHGETLTGVEDKGPPFLHEFYLPGHHGDAAFFAAVVNGAQAHHWGFGDMPPVPGLTQAEIGAIVDFVRSVQKANGLF